MPDRLDLLIECLVPAGAGVHVVIHKQHIVCRHQRPETVQRITHANVLLRMCKLQSFCLHPVERTVTTVIHMNQQFMLIRGILTDTRHAEFQEFQIIPRWNQY